MDSKTLCLGVLTLGEASGYEIRKQFEDGMFAYFHGVSLGSIYPALAKLSAEGLVTVRGVQQDGKPDKKLYRITETGQTAFRAALDKDSSPDQFRSEALYRLFFAELLTPERRRQVYDAYLEFHRVQLAEMESYRCAAELADAPPGQRFVHGAGLVSYRAFVEYMESQRPRMLGEEEPS